MCFLVSNGVWRGFAEMSLGCISYQIVAVMKKHMKEKKHHLFIPKIIIILLSVFVLCVITKSDIKDFTALFLIVILVCLLFLDDSKCHHFFDNKLSFYLGEISYHFYLNQIIVIYLSRILPQTIMSYNLIFTYIILNLSNFIISVITLCFFKKLLKG